METYRRSWLLAEQERRASQRSACYSESVRPSLRSPYQAGSGSRQSHTHTKARILDGKTVSAKWAEASTLEVEKLKQEHGIVPGLAVR
jgi:hypothetical protein